jgi:hypothetical protein
MALTAPNKHDLDARLSYISSTSKAKDGEYKAADTPDIEGGALREGGPPVLTSRDNIGLLFQYAAVGLTYGVMPATIYPFLQQYLNTSGTQVTVATQLVVFPWSFKAFYGALSDCVPIFGLRRKPYMLIGWTICIAMMLVMACMPAGDPYFTISADRDIKPADYTPEIEARINYDASNQAGKYVMLMFFAAFGYVMSDVCADGIVVDLAQREPLEIRGKTQSMIYIVRTAVVIVGQILVGFCFNGKEYGGDFDFSLTFPQVMIIVTVCSCPILPITWFFIKEEVKPRVNFKLYMADLWELMQKRVVWQVIAYTFFAGIFQGITYTATSPVKSYMIGVTPINSTLSDILGNLLFLAGIAATSKYGLHWNWRWMIVFTGAVVYVIDCATTLISVWDVFRSQWFWLGPPIAVQVPYGIGWMIATFVIVELAGVGQEGVMYGLVTTVANLATPFATSLTLVIDQPFNLTTERVQTDDHSIRMDITYAVIIMYVMMCFSWVFLFLLPRQKEETQELLRTGGSSKLMGYVTVFYILFAFVWSIMTNIMAMFDSTSCLLIAGGSGC